MGRVTRMDFFFFFFFFYGISIPGKQRELR